MRAERTWNVLGLIFGILIILTGFVICYSTQAEIGFSATKQSNFPSGETVDYASFGGDFYTYQYDATRVVASNTAGIATNIANLSSEIFCNFNALGTSMNALGTLLLSVIHILGTLIIITGGLVFISYGKKLSLLKMRDTEKQLPVE